MAWMQLAGIGLSALSSYMGNKQQSAMIEAQNKAKLQQFETNKTIIAEMLGTLDSRTSRAESEAVRTAIRTKLNTRKAQIQAEGSATVKAAQMGGGAGRRASLALFRPAARIAGDMITDANVNLQTELTNITEHFNDTADKAIQNLNNNSPLLGATSSNTASVLMDMAGAGLNYWNRMSDPSKAEVAGIFKGDATPDNNTLLRNQHTQVGEAAILE